jgi:N-acetyl-anhydromuramyl-L-alanine amidase AmpD
MRRSRTEGIVVHRAEVFTTTDYHYVVGRDGAIRRVVALEEKGAHAKDYNATTVGIALFGDFAALEPGANHHATDVQIDATVALMRTVNAFYSNTLWATGHSRLGSKGTDVPLKLVAGHTCPGENLPLDDIIRRSGCKPFAPPFSVA